MSTDYTQPSKHPLDAPYDTNILSIIRDHIHKSIVSKATSLNRNEYIIVFNEADEELRDIAYQAGNPIQIMLCCHPYNGIRVELLARRAFSLPDNKLQELKRFYQVTRRSDAVKWYGIDISGDPILDQLHERMTEITNYKPRIERSVWVKVTITDPVTGRKVSVEQKNGNAFDCQIEAIKILRSPV